MLRIVFAEQENSNLNTASKNIMQTKKAVDKNLYLGVYKLNRLKRYIMRRAQ